MKSKIFTFIFLEVLLIFTMEAQTFAAGTSDDGLAGIHNIQEKADPNSAVYLLITSESLRDVFQLLVDRRTSQGKTGKLITVEEIYANPAYTGNDMQEEIRNCIRDHYLNCGTQWVCLGGDDTIIPIRYCLPRTTYGEVPADIYYADLDGGTWDLDIDGIYGEPGDVTEADMTPEVFYGRIPAATSQHVTDYIDKVILYESAGPDGFANSWLYLARGISEGQRPSGNDRPEDFLDYDPYPGDMRHYYREDIQPYWQATPAHFFSDGFTSWDQQVYGDYPFNADNVVDIISSGYHHVAYSGHGWTWHLERSIFGPDHVLQLTNPIPCIVRSGGCSSAAFDQAYAGHQEVMMPDAFLFNPNGGSVIFFGYCRTTGTGAPQERLWEEIFKHKIRNSGEAFAAMKKYFAPLVLNDPYYQYIYVFLGDPAIDFMQEEPDRNLHMDSPNGCEVFDIEGDLVIYWSAAGNGFGPAETVRLEYSDDSGTNWQAVPGAETLEYNNRTFTWERPSLPEGQTYQIRVVSNAQPSVWDGSRTDFSIRRLGLLTVTSTPLFDLQAWGTHPNFTNYTFTVIIGSTVTLEAPEITDLTFTGWKDTYGNLLHADRSYSFDFFEDTELIFEYAYLGPITPYYINDELAEPNCAPGEDNNDGLSPQTPMRHIQAILDRYTELGWGEVINVSAGIYVENIVISENHTGLTLRGVGQHNTILNGNHLGPCLVLDSFSVGSISGFTIKNGSTDRGGGISCIHASPAISNCIFHGNEAEGGYGGGVYIAGNSCPKIVNCTFENNSARKGGAICNNMEMFAPQVYNCIFIYNDASSYGGAIYNTGSCKTKITDCIFINNSGWRGGGICNYGQSEATVSGCLFQTNNASLLGGAIYNTGSCSPRIEKSVLAGNSAKYGAAIANVADSTPTIVNCTITGNSATSGGGMRNYNNSAPSVTNCIFWGNTPDEIYVSDGIPVVTYCDVQGGWPGIGNIDLDPYFLESGFWDSNGTPEDDNDDFWVHGDYHLKSQAGRWEAFDYPSANFDTTGTVNLADFAQFSQFWLVEQADLAADLDSDGLVGIVDLCIFAEQYLTSGLGQWKYDSVTSRCIDAGNPGMSIGPEYPDPTNIRINMGAYGGTSEASRSPSDWSLTADTNNNGIVNLTDYAIFCGYFSQTDENLPGDFNHDGVVNVVDLTYLTADWLEITTWYIP